MAIAFDATSSGNANATSLTFSHTCSGSERVLWVGCYVSGGDNITGITYAGVSMTKMVGTPMDSGYYLYLWYLAAPATGANNIVITPSGTRDMLAISSSYTGAKQTGIPDAQVTNTTVAGQTSMTTTATVVAANSWLVAIYRNNAGTWTAGANTLKRIQSPASSAMAIMDSNSAQAAGSRSLTATCSSASVTGIMASFTEYVAPSGPANLKSYNTNVKSNIKSIDTNLIANVKALNTNT